MQGMVSRESLRGIHVIETLTPFCLRNVEERREACKTSEEEACKAWLKGNTHDI